MENIPNNLFLKIARNDQTFVLSFCFEKINHGLGNASRLGYSFFTLIFFKKILDYVLNLNICYRFFTKINMPLIHNSDFRCVFHTFHKVRIVSFKVFFLGIFYRLIS
jgi:hypothetical protein